MKTKPTLQTTRLLPAKPPSNTLLWFAILGGPTLFLANQQVNYLLVYWACETGNLFALHAVTLVCLAVTTWLGIAAARVWRQPAFAGDLEPSETRDNRRRFMAAVGALSSLLSALGILALAAPTFFIDPCQR